MANGSSEISLSDTAYLAIRDQLLEKRWGPNDRISEQSLAEELGISRTPVREAIKQMVAKCLLVPNPAKLD